MARQAGAASEAARPTGGGGWRKRRAKRNGEGVPRPAFLGGSFFAFFGIPVESIRRAAPILVLGAWPGPKTFFLRLANPPVKNLPVNFFLGFIFLQFFLYIFVLGFIFR